MGRSIIGNGTSGRGSKRNLGRPTRERRASSRLASKATIAGSPTTLRSAGSIAKVTIWNGRDRWVRVGVSSREFTTFDLGVDVFICLAREAEVDERLLAERPA